MKPTLKFFYIAIISSLIIFAGCTKQGPTGPIGANGANGINGTSGGAVNVVNQYIAITPSQLTWDTTANQWYYNFSTQADFSSSIHAAVLVYAQSSNGLEATPYTNSKKNYTISFANNMYQSTPFIRFEYFNGTSTCPLPTFNINVELVIIPPQIVIPNVNHHNYAAVKAAYNL
jgi:hypothetical protein